MKPTIILSLLALTALPGHAIELKLKWQTGKRYVFVQETSSQATIPMGELKMTTETAMTQILFNDVTPHEKGFNVRTSFKEIKMKTSMNGAVAMEFDSTDPAKSGGLIGNALAPLAASKFDAIYNKAGEIVEMKGLDEVQDAEQLGLGKAELEAMARQSSLLLPKRDVQAGDTWTAKVDLPLGGLGQDAVLSYTCKLKGVEEQDGKQIATISMTGKMAPDPEDQKEKVLTMEAKKITGTILFDVELGQPIETRTVMELEMGVPGGLAGGAPGQAAPGKMPVKATSVQKLSSVEDLPKGEVAPEKAPAEKAGASK